MKRLASILLALTMALSLAACGEGGLNLNPGGGKDDDSDVKYGYIGDAMSTEWFDFTVNDAYSCAQYEDHAAQAGNQLVVVTMTLKNTFGESVDMWGDDFVILWDDPDENSGIDIPLAAGVSDDQFPDEYTLKINETRAGIMVFEVPEGFRDFAVGFQEIYEDTKNPENLDGIEGNTFFVSFTAEEK